MRPILGSSMEPDEPSACGNPWKWIQMPHRRISEPTGCTKPPPDSTRCTSHWTPSHTSNQGQKTVTHIYSPSHSSPCTQYLLFFIHYLSKEQQQQQTHISLISTVNVLCLVLITEWKDMGIQGGFHCQNCRVRAGLVFINRRRCYLHILLAV